LATLSSKENEFQQGRAGCYGLGYRIVSLGSPERTRYEKMEDDPYLIPVGFHPEPVTTQPFGICDRIVVAP